MKQLTAKNPSIGITIVQRWLNGDRYLKVTPKRVMPMIQDRLKQMWGNKPIEMVKGKKGWLKIIKRGRDKDMEEKVKKNMDKQGENVKDKMDEDYIIEKEAKMLRKQGFKVKIEDIEE